jgi:hypothetical protein
MLNQFDTSKEVPTGWLNFLIHSMLEFLKVAKNIRTFGPCLSIFYFMCSFLSTADISGIYVFLDVHLQQVSIFL